MPHIEGITWLTLSCFGLTIVSALVPWVNAEVILLSFVANASSRVSVAAFIVVATMGQMVGKCLLLWMSRRALKPRVGSTGRTAASLERLTTKLAGQPAKTYGLVLVSSVVGIPPFYLVTMAAGALRVNVGMFVACGGVGRLARFSAIGMAARLVS